MTISYPRQCPNCQRSYSSRSTYSQHNRIGTCEKTQQKNALINQEINGNNNNIQNNNIQNNTQNTQNNIIINVQGDGLTKEQISERIDAVLNSSALTELKKLLHGNDINTAEQVMKHVKKNTSTIKEIQETMSIHADLLKEKLSQILDDTVDKESIYPLQLLFQRVFLHVSQGGEITLKDLRRRVIKKSDSRCDVLSAKTKNDNKVPDWTRRHWDTLIAELLHFLGTRLIEARFALLGRLEQYKNATKDQVKQVLLKQNHPFFKWWASIEQYEDIQFDTKGKQLIKTIADQITKDCKDDLIQGWYRLIECCSVLYTSAPPCLVEERVEQKDGNKMQRKKNKKLEKEGLGAKSKSQATEILSDL